MENVNYITQLNNVFERFHNDQRIKQGHITLYLAFFHKWNRKFFQKTLTINRELIMERAKIKSKTTYHNYLRDLHNWEYLRYYPSYHPAIGSKINMIKFSTSTGTLEVQNLAVSDPEPRQNLVPFYKHKTKENFNKQHNKIFNELEVLLFFKTNNWPEIEGKKFYAYYRSKHWEINESQNIKNWQEIAKNFVQNGFKINQQKQVSPFSGFVDNLNKKRDQKYGQ
ncbi:hypothetical protein [Polaribacter staleyi]|uniref:hypothetical protein n=1 Tax=Polaribacter staleyi TaxID=2022337 RepID=UPI0031BAC5BC